MAPQGVGLVSAAAPRFRAMTAIPSPGSPALAWLPCFAPQSPSSRRGRRSSRGHGQVAEGWIVAVGGRISKFVSVSAPSIVEIGLRVAESQM